MNIPDTLGAKLLYTDLLDNDNDLAAGDERLRGRSINAFLGGASIDFEKLRGKSHGRYNMGEIVVKNKGGHLSLGIINHHVGGYADKNDKVTTWEDRYRTNMAVFKAILNHYVETGDAEQAEAAETLLSKDLSAVTHDDFASFRNKHIETAFDFLLGKDSLDENARPLSRDEAACLFSILDKHGENEKVTLLDVQRLKDLRAFKAGKFVDPAGIRDLVKGFSVTNAGSERRARVMQVSVNQRVAEDGRAKPEAGLLEEVENPGSQVMRDLDSARKILSTEMSDVGHLVLERVVDVACKYGTNLNTASSWDVAKTLSKGVVAKITAAVDQYNARVPDEASRVTRSLIAKVVIERMMHALQTLLKDGGHEWNDEAWQSFANVLKDGFNRKLRGEAGYPASKRENLAFFTGKPIEPKPMASGRTVLFAPSRGGYVQESVADVVNACMKGFFGKSTLEKADALKKVMMQEELTSSQMADVVMQLMRGLSEDEASEAALLEHVMTNCGLSTERKADILESVMADGDLSTAQKSLLLEQTMHGEDALAAKTATLERMANSRMSAEDKVSVLKHLIENGRFDSTEIAVLREWLKTCGLNKADRLAALNLLLKCDGLTKGDLTSIAEAFDLLSPNEDRQ